MTDLDALSDITERLQQAAAALRSGDVTPGRAAELVDECARLAGEAAAELDRRARAAGEPPAAQDSLLSAQDSLL
jgi:hypothetical protein